MAPSGASHRHKSIVLRLTGSRQPTLDDAQGKYLQAGVSGSQSLTRAFRDHLIAPGTSDFGG